MLTFEIIFFSVYFLLLGTLVFLGFFIQTKKELTFSSIRTNLNSIHLNEIVVIVPFRNEEKRIECLLNSILPSNELPKEFLFVNDHSSDKSVALISEKLIGIPHRIIELPEGQEGKKHAIRFAIEQSSSEYILSFDADIEFNPNYFSKLKNLLEADLYILPAILKAKKFHEHLYEVDLILVNAANCGIAGLKRPIMASGANLLYKREAFEKFDNFESHSHMPSGDDIYLLRDFRYNNAAIRLITETDFSIETETPQSLKEFFHQRLRWIAKTGDVKDYVSTSLAIIQVVLTFCFVLIASILALNGQWKMFMVFFILKTSVDMLIFLPYFNRIKRMKSWLFIPIYELLFPIYSLVILCAMYVYKPVWKGRRLDTNY
jgi:cellulose synthase/poly-beta-1,6-N-acetylglucosamine synthase-like glycosyltransferase